MHRNSPIPVAANLPDRATRNRKEAAKSLRRAVNRKMAKRSKEVVVDLVAGKVQSEQGQEDGRDFD